MTEIPADVRKRLLEISNNLVAAFNGYYHKRFPERTGPALLKAIVEIRTLINATEEECSIKPQLYS